MPTIKGRQGLTGTLSAPSRPASTHDCCASVEYIGEGVRSQARGDGAAVEQTGARRLCRQRLADIEKIPSQTSIGFELFGDSLDAVHNGRVVSAAHDAADSSERELHFLPE